MKIEDIKNIFIEAIRGKRKICFFVGAGISKDFDQSGELCLDFKGFNKKVLESIAIGEKELEQYFHEKISNNQRARPEIVLQLAKEEISNKVMTSLDLLLGDNLNSYHRFLARALKAGNYVFTTNFENRIEKACKEIDYKPNVCILDEDYYKFLSRQTNDENLDDGYIFKLHGSIDEKESTIEKRYKSIIISLNDVGKGLSKFKKETLEKFLQRQI
jgi:NAD-dependent SIR2 family protein deacetylase